MQKLAKLALLLVVAASALLVAACPERKSIAEIEANPGRYQNKEVAIAGIVKDSYGLNIPLTKMRGGIYKIDDGTGTMWVVTEQSVPSKGTEIGIKGKIMNGVNWNGRNYGLGMMEQDRRFRTK